MCVLYVCIYIYIYICMYIYDICYVSISISIKNIHTHTYIYIYILIIIYIYIYILIIIHPYLRQGLDALIEAVKGPDARYGREALSLIDLLLKWVSLRFFDTNPTVLFKTMLFLQELFATAALVGILISTSCYV